MVCHFFENLGLEREIELQLNSVGCMVCRPRYLKVLSLYLKDYESELCPDCKLKLKKNLLRILDCKKCNNITSGAPLILDYLCDDCKGHMTSVKKYLSQFGVTFTMNPRLVRGLDYYTRTTFEFIDSTFGAQNAVAAGGRYDRLIEELGGPGTPAVGFAAGLERMILALKSHKLMRKVQFQVELYLVSYDSVGREEIPSLANVFRQSGFSVEFDLSGKDLRGQMKLANRAGARFTLIIKNNSFTLRDMITGKQEEVPKWRLNTVKKRMRDEIKKNSPLW
jgi:histidyl-tRNA synthetase